MANKYPAWWNTTVTLYHKYLSNNTITWYKTVLANSFWRNSNGLVLKDNYVVSSDSVICRIRKNQNYTEPGTWNAMSSANKATHFTITEGDIVVLGQVSDTINEYVANQRSTDLLAKYRKSSSCMTVHAIVLNVGTLKVAEHYLLTGV